jgi:superfamily II DNA or RNA helicase
MPDIEKKYKDKLFSYQVGNVNNIIRILNSNGAILDASDTGTGKTYTAVAACAQLGLQPIVICPKAIVANWKKVCALFNVKPLFVVNYETLKYGKYYDNKGKRKICPYIIYDKNKNKNENENENKNPYSWKLQKNANIIFIFDEVHKCTNFDTFNGQLLLSAKDTGLLIMILSATIADSPNKIKMFSYILNFIDKTIVEKQKITFKKYIAVIDNWIGRDITPMVRIHNMLYPDRGTRMRSDMIVGFPETQISAIAYTMGEKKEAEIQKEYDNIADLLDELKNKKNKDRANILVKILRAHQKIELLKIPTFIELAKQFRDEEGRSVVIFVNFTQTLKTLSQMLDTRCLIYGDQTDTERQRNINDFQDNVEKLIICNIKAGAVGISLHDLTGKHPRISLISPTYNCVDFVQALGRVHRAGGKSKSLQRVIYTANTVEEKICDKLAMKLKDLNSLNNGDFDLMRILDRDS